MTAGHDSLATLPTGACLGVELNEDLVAADTKARG